MLEKLSQLKSTLSETYFTKKSDETQKPITDPKSDSKSQEKKKKRSAQKSDSESDSDDDFRPPRTSELVEIRVFQKGPPGPAKSSPRWPDMLFSLKLVWVPPLGSPGACFRPNHPS